MPAAKLGEIHEECGQRWKPIVAGTHVGGWPIWFVRDGETELALSWPIGDGDVTVLCEAL